MDSQSLVKFGLCDFWSWNILLWHTSFWWFDTLPFSEFMVNNHIIVKAFIWKQ